jgi:hypothetical protein
MLYEYAVEPRAIASSWETCRYLSEKFGFDCGRRLAQYPGKWLPLAIEAASHLPDVEKKTVVERLLKLKRDASIRSGRLFDATLNDWLSNAVKQHLIKPFRAILASQNPHAHEFILTPGEVTEEHSLIISAHDFTVEREAETIAASMSLLLETANLVMFVDAYYDPFNGKYQRTLRECLKLIHLANPKARCEIHHKDHERCPPAHAIEHEAKLKFGGTIPAGMTVTIYRWREKDHGADFHARYLLTDRGGIKIDSGFSAEGSCQKTDMSWMDIALAKQRRMALQRDADVYELVEPVLQIASNGYVERV